MTNKNSTNDFDKNFDQLFVGSVPEIDQDAKNIAINQALENFSQGFEESPRLIDNRDNWFSSMIQSIRSFFMNTIHKPALSNTFATVAVAFIALSVVLLIPNLNDELDGELANDTSLTSHNPTRPTTFPEPTSSLEEVVVTATVAKSSEDASTPSSSQQSVVRAESPAELNAHRPPIAARKEVIATAKKQSDFATNTQSYADSFQGLSQAPVPSRDYKIDADKARVRQQTVRPDGGEEYAEYSANSITRTIETPVSTFSIDVDTASYSLVRNQLNRGFLPRPQAVRAEELINYFNYDYPLPESKKQPFAPSISVLDSPWNEGKKLVHIGIKGYDIAPDNTPDSNLVFLLDVSGSMNAANKLPLVKQSINLLLDTLKPSDTVSIVVYAGAAGMVLEPTVVKERNKIVSALQRLSAGGSTAGGAGIELAYSLAEQNFNKDAVNRIILATDGDFNVGQNSNQDLKTLVERKRDNGVLLSVLGFGRNNYQDDMMQTLAQNGNGVAAYIDSLSEAKKVLVDEATSTLFTIAKDVKLQVEFNPSVVSEYRLIGFETRALNREDFNNDKVDAGDIGAGHTVTAIYEVTPSDAKNQSIDPARYAQNKEAIADTNSNEIGFLKIRYKAPNASKSDLITQVIPSENTKTNSEADFSVAVAGFAQLLANSQHTGDLSYDDVIKLASKNKGEDSFGYRSEFIQLARMAKIAQP